MSDTITLIHYCITGLTTVVVGLGVAFLKLKEKKVDADSICKQDFQELQTKVAVLEERINNEITMLSKLDDKLDQIRDRL